MVCSVCGKDRPGLFDVHNNWVCTKCYKKRCNKTLDNRDIELNRKPAKNPYGIRIMKIITGK